MNLNRLLLLTVMLGVLSARNIKDIKKSDNPVSNAHAHNDYLHKQPLYDALRFDFISVESDIFLKNGDLLVGHDHSQLKKERTLEALYLVPLAKEIEKNGGRVQNGRETFYLLIDIKSKAEPTYEALKKKLRPYHFMLTKFDKKSTSTGAVTIIISGNRPIAAMRNENQRWVGLDGRVSDLVNKPNRHLMPWISDNWRSYFRWDGRGEMPETEQVKLQSFVQQAHKNGQMIRFWGTPDVIPCWQVQIKAGVDFINSDRLKDLAGFLKGKD
jgi:hypothetical protein